VLQAGTTGECAYPTALRRSSVLQCAAVCCSMLQRVAGGNDKELRLSYGVAQVKCLAVCCSVLQCVAVCCGVLQCVAVYCGVLQRVAVCCSVLQRVAGGNNRGVRLCAHSPVVPACNTLQHTTLRTLVLHNVALPCRNDRGVRLRCAGQVCCSVL